MQTKKKLITFGEEASNCYYCYNKEKDKIDHILVNGIFTNYICKIHAKKVGTEHSFSNMRSVLMHWISLEYQNVVQNILFHVLPNFI